jgi:hypothetical protein
MAALGAWRFCHGIGAACARTAMYGSVRGIRRAPGAFRASVIVDTARSRDVDRRHRPARHGISARAVIETANGDRNRDRDESADTQSVNAWLANRAQASRTARHDWLRFLQLQLRELQTVPANAAIWLSNGAGARVAFLQVIMSNADLTQPIAQPSSRSWLHWIAASTAVVLVAGILTGCLVETGHYHRPYHRVVYVR